MTRNRKNRLAQFILLAALLPSVTLAAEQQSQQDMAQRVERLERIIKGQGLISLLARVDQLQNEVQRLNGENEELNHRLDQLQESQRKMYLDLDQRLQQAQSNQSTNMPAQPGMPETAETDDTAGAAQPETAQQPVAADNNVPQQAAEETNTTAPVAVENGEAAYQEALQTLRSGQYEQAITALKAFPQQYPQSVYLPNVYYWEGEAHYVLRQFDEAITAFQTVLDQYPSSTKVADALLKRGFSEYEKGDVIKAKETLNTVRQQYPNTSAARLAKVRLDRIKEEER